MIFLLLIIHQNQIMTQPDHQNQEDGFDIDQSHGGMDSAEQQLFLNVRRSKSDQSFLGKLLINKSQIQKRPLILNFNNQPQISNNNTGGFKVFKKIKKQRKKNQSDYRKNICGYITKKIIREFVSPNYANFVNELCRKHHCDYNLMKSYYLSQIQHITGPSHIPGLLIPDKDSEIPIKNVFKEFFQWFLKERYLRYLLIEGKMADKKAYIEYKNNILMGILSQVKQGKKGQGIKIQHNKEEQNSMSEKSQQIGQISDEEKDENEHKNKARCEIKSEINEQEAKKQKLVPMIPIVKKQNRRN